MSLSSLRAVQLSARALRMKDVFIGIVGHRDVQGAQWEGGRGIWRILDERNDIGDSKVGLLGHVAGSRKTG
jgi:hypothetical protein